LFHPKRNRIQTIDANTGLKEARVFVPGIRLDPLLFVVPKALEHILLERKKIQTVGGKTPESLNDCVVGGGHSDSGERIRL
jgi:hypothetical protein